MTIPVPTIDRTGFHMPAFSDVHEGYKAAYRAIYGQDVNLDPDTQDGQWIAIQAKAHMDLCSAIYAAYKARTPSEAEGTALSSVVKLNGIKRHVASYSSADVRLIGQANTLINNGLVRDINGVVWTLPTDIQIPMSGEITVTATSTKLGAVEAAAGDINQIATPSAGWQSASNPDPAVPGAPVESDAALRMRQAVSTELPALTSLEGLIAAVAAIPGVIRFAAYENDTNVTDSLGIPSHSICFVIEGGDAQMIAAVIQKKKTPGASTVGTTYEDVEDAYGIAHRIRFYRPTSVPITFQLTVRARYGYSTEIQNAIAQTISDWVDALGIGQSVVYSRAFLPAILNGSVNSKTYDVVSLGLARDGGSIQQGDVPIGFHEVPASDPSYVTFRVL